MTIEEKTKVVSTMYFEDGHSIQDVDVYLGAKYIAEWMLEKALDVLDNMFMEQGSISVDDWFRDSKNLFQGRESFKRRMDE